MASVIRWGLLAWTLTALALATVIGRWLRCSRELVEAQAEVLLRLIDSEEHLEASILALPEDEPWVLSLVPPWLDRTKES